FIEINNRKILNGILEYANVEKSKSEKTIIVIDKLKKYGVDSVKKELNKIGLSEEKIKKILSIINIKGSNLQVLKKLKSKLKNEIAKEGIEELELLFFYLKEFNVEVKFNPSLARGLAYYTGPIYEIYLKDSKITSSVAGGGRWDDMIGKFLGRGKYPATGIAFGLEPITEALKLKNKQLKKCVTEVYIIPIKTTSKCIKIAQKLRENNINVDMALSEKGITKGLNYANSLKIPYVIIVGSEELKKKKLKIKNMVSGKEKLLTLNETIKYIKKIFKK
ncbi:MAG: ATP phosphoribosyltransferase regulatory subunit, partial [Promethearchaeota archaeon]